MAKSMIDFICLSVHRKFEVHDRLRILAFQQDLESGQTALIWSSNRCGWISVGGINYGKDLATMASGFFTHFIIQEYLYVPE